MAVTVLLVWLPVALVPSRRLAARLSRAGSRALLRLAGCSLSREGAWPAHAGPVLIASNHASYADALTLLALVPSDFVFAVKPEVRSWPLIGTIVRRAGHLTVERFEHNLRNALRFAKYRIDRVPKYEIERCGLVDPYPQPQR